VALFCNPASGSTFSNIAIETIKWVKKICSSASEGDPHLEAWKGVVEDTESLCKKKGLEKVKKHGKKTHTM
jgi:hypothetical protein